VTLPAAKALQHDLGDGLVALPQSLLWLAGSRTLVAADAHLAYEDVIGGALPLWSTDTSVQTILQAAQRQGAREILLLGDVIHGSGMSEGAAQIVGDALRTLRACARVTLIAGNHEGRTRGAAILGETEEAVERDGWLLVHGDVPIAGARTIVGHLHPSLPLGGEATIPAFLASPSLVVVPALTPYSRGLNVLSHDCTEALRSFGLTSGSVNVVASGEDAVFPFGALGALRGLFESERAKVVQTLERRVRDRYTRNR